MPVQSITRDEAVELTAAYREEHGLEFSKGYSFRRNEIDAILAQAGCTGIRIYYGRDGFGKFRLVLAGITGTINNEGENETDLNDIHVDANSKFAEYGISTVDACDQSNSPLARTI